MTEGSELEIFAATIDGEARGESLLGKQAVADTILNRTELAGWSNQIWRVCLQRRQFSCWNNNDPNFHRAVGFDINDSSYWPSLYVALGCISGIMADPTGGADHYHSKRIALPSWAVAQVPIAEIGGHVFYRLYRRL